jgi:hypothetical protein
MDHDRLFKELLSNFFIELIDLFLPDVAAYLDREAEIVPLDKEIFTDVTQGDKHEVDLLMKVKFRGEDAFFLIHIENQSSTQSDFPRRMFLYFARLTAKYNLPVYPVVIYSHDTPVRPEPSQFTVAFPGKTVLRFDYKVIQLNRLPWRKFVNQQNPLASALMAKMKMSPDERPRVKLECLRLLASLKLDPARTKLIGGFVDSYLELTAAEMKRYEREIARLNPTERKKTMEIITSWERRGIDKGKEAIVLRIMRKRFGSVSTQATEKVDRLSSEQLDELADALLDDAPLDLDQWLSTHAPTATS